MRASPAAPDTLGLIAGNGTFPLLVARAARERGMRVVAVAHRGETRPELEALTDAITWVRVGQVGAMLAAFRRAHVHRAVMAGGIDKRRLFYRARPDWRGLWLLAHVARRRDDALLRAVASFFERHNIEILASTAYLPQALAPAGVLTGHGPKASEWADLRDGLQLAHRIGLLDVGQTVALRKGCVVALEAIEGTDACIARAGSLTGGRGVVIVKAAKPGQDMRFDVPTVGPETIRHARAAGVTALGMEAHRTLLLAPEETVALAQASGIALVGLEASLP
jgi:DUF1009 family protein